MGNEEYSNRWLPVIQIGTNRKVEKTLAYTADHALLWELPYQIGRRDNSLSNLLETDWVSIHALWTRIFVRSLEFSSVTRFWRDVASGQPITSLEKATPKSTAQCQSVWLGSDSS